MTPDRESLLKIYSIGIVVADKPDGSNTIEVYPVEELPTVKGSIKDFQPKFSSKIPNASGVAQNAAVTGGATIQAEWRSMGDGNRQTSPDVVKNETVLIWRYADTDKYYWNDYGVEPGIRRLERVIYAWSNIPTPLVKFDQDSSYWIMVSTKDKLVKLHTSKNNGEPFAYDITINTLTGDLTIKDDAGNLLHINSAQQQVELKNGAGTHLELLGTKLTITAADVAINASSSFKVTAPIASIN